MAKMTRREALGFLGGLGVQLYGLDLLAGSCGAPPPAKKQRWKAAESFPPLPLPATPLRRSEKKRPPAPPTLLGKLQYGKLVSATDAKGRRYTYRDWTTDPGDAKNLMRRANVELGVRYRNVETDFRKFSFKPQEIPLLLLTGHEGFAFTDEQRQTIRRFVHDGGTLIGDACCGMEPYRASFLKEIHRIFPQRRMKILPGDHPVYTAFHTVDKVGYLDEERGRFSGPPVLEGITVGCREAVFLSQYDLTCGWDGHKHERGKRVWPASDALRLGVNMVAYALATYRLGLYLATTAVYHEKDAAAAGDLVVGQILHGGDWDPNPSSLGNLAKHCLNRSTLQLRFRREDVDLKKAAALEQPLLYMTGHDEFAFSASEIARLRRYLTSGGVLFADACCGRSAFDKAFRRELAKILPDHPLRPLAPDHQLFRMVADTSRVAPTAALAAKRKGAGAPPLAQPAFEGVHLGSGLAVVYSSLGIGCGWEDEACPYCLGYAPASARDLGMNVLAFAMTH